MNQTFQSSQQTAKPLTILFGSNYQVGLTGEFLSIALERMGHKVIPFTPVKDAPDGWIQTDTQVDMPELVNGIGAKPDIFLYVETSIGRPFLPKRIDELEMPTACWLYDNYLNFRWNKEMASLFDYCFFAQLNRTRLAQRYGASNVQWLPFAADEVFHRNRRMERDIDVGYVGSITPQKQKYFDAFGKSGIKVVTNNHFLTNDGVGEFYSRCKLVYNILARRDMNVRTFEGSYAGALVVNQGWIDEGCQRIFTDGENMVFHDFDDAPAICAGLLDNDEERETMAQNAEHMVATRHTYKHRAQTILDVCAAGVTQERLERSRGFMVNVAEALICQHPHFRFRQRAMLCLGAAMRKSFFNTSARLLKYGWYRVMEKVEKLRWSTGKAPV